jgi:hypothetical protein
MADLPSGSAPRMGNRIGLSSSDFDRRQMAALHSTDWKTPRRWPAASRDRFAATECVAQTARVLRRKFPQTAEF